MPAPPAIVDALESVMEIYFSGLRGRERAAFILCDNLVEMACKSKALQFNHQFNMMSSFHSAWNAPGVHLDPGGLGQRVQENRNTRNNMQHANAAATVDAQHCATAINDVIRVIEHCWPSSTVASALSQRMRCARRMISLYSEGDHVTRHSFEKLMAEKRWRTTDRETVRANARQVEPGLRDHWWLALRMQYVLVEECLNEAGA